MERRWEMTGGGELAVTDDGGLVRLEAQREDDGRGLYKVWLQGEGSGRLLLGTLCPDGGRLRLCRRLTRQSLTASGCWPLAGARCVLAWSFGRGWIRSLCPPVADGVVGPGLEGRQVLQHRQEGGGFRLAFPLDPRRPFPLPALFCIGRVERVEGEVCVVYDFDGQGRPCWEEKHC
jgi:hypothetical protein